MKTLFSSLIILFLTAGHAAGVNQNIEKTIISKISKDLNLTLNINDIGLNDGILDKNSIPDYKLFEVTIIGKEHVNNKIRYSFKINNFINIDEFKIIEVDIPVKFKASKSRTLKQNSRIKILYKNNGIEIYDIGIIQKVMADGMLSVRNSFGRITDCRLISDHIALAEAEAE
jgi:hypothetical protein